MFEFFGHERFCTVFDVTKLFHTKMFHIFVPITESLTVHQLNLLRAIIAGRKALSSAETMSQYRLGSSANVTRSRRSLIEKDILDDKAGELSFQDPMYRHWLKRSYFAIIGE